jgi:hypothetical protein
VTLATTALNRWGPDWWFWSTEQQSIDQGKLASTATIPSRSWPQSLASFALSDIKRLDYEVTTRWCNLNHYQSTGWPINFFYRSRNRDNMQRTSDEVISSDCFKRGSYSNVIVASLEGVIRAQKWESSVWSLPWNSFWREPSGWDEKRQNRLDIK